MRRTIGGRAVRPSVPVILPTTRVPFKDTPLCRARLLLYRIAEAGTIPAFSSKHRQFPVYVIEQARFLRDQAVIGFDFAYSGLCMMPIVRMMPITSCADRLVQNAHRSEVKGEAMRKKRVPEGAKENP